MVKGTVEILPGWWENGDLTKRVFQSVLLLPDQLPQHGQQSGEYNLLKEVFCSAFDDLKEIKYRLTAIEWLLTDCGTVTSRMCLHSLGVEDDAVPQFRRQLKKFLVDKGFLLDKEINKN